MLEIVFSVEFILDSLSFYFEFEILQKIEKAILVSNFFEVLGAVVKIGAVENFFQVYRFIFKVITFHIFS